MIKAVFFDIDDTLYHFSDASNAAMEEVADYAFEELGIERDVFFQTVKKAMRIIADRLGETHPSTHNREIRFQNAMEILGKPIYPHSGIMYRIYWDSVIQRAKPEEGIQDLLELLKEKEIYLGIGTDMTSYIQNRKLEKLGLAPYFSSVVTSEEAGKDKPSKEIFELCAKKANVSPKECLFIGDSLKKDIIGARNAGMQTACYNRYSRADEKEAGCVILSYKECIKENQIRIGEIQI